MSQLPEAFQGHDLTGWTEYEIHDPFTHKSVFRIGRNTKSGELLWMAFTSSGAIGLWGSAFSSVLTSGDMADCFKYANEYAERLGGWAPAPIGFSADPGWQPIETYPIPPGPTFPAFTGGNSDTGFVGECYWASVGQEFQHYGGPVELTHWRPLPAPLEAT